MPKKILTLTLFALCTLALKAQQVNLAWKLTKDDFYTYKCTFKDIDTTQLTFSLDQLVDLSSDSAQVIKKQTEQLFKDIQKELEKADMTVVVRRLNASTLRIEMLLNKDEKSSYQYLSNIMDKLMLRGEIGIDGKIESFYLKRDQKNLLSILFELPGKPIKIGDKWKLETNLITVDQNFICDSSYYQNEVTLLDIKTENNDTIAVLNYDIDEYITGNFDNKVSGQMTPTYMAAGYKGTAEFNITKGCWNNLGGLLYIKSTGILESTLVKKLRLVKQ